MSVKRYPAVFSTFGTRGTADHPDADLVIVVRCGTAIHSPLGESWLAGSQGLAWVRHL